MILFKEANKLNYCADYICSNLQAVKTAQWKFADCNNNKLTIVFIGRILNGAHYKPLFQQLFECIREWKATGLS